MNENEEASTGLSARGGGSTSTDNHQILTSALAQSSFALAAAIEESVRLRAEAARRIEEVEHLRLLLKKQNEEKLATEEANKRGREALFAALEKAVKERDARLERLEEADRISSLENLRLKEEVQELKSTVASSSEGKLLPSLPSLRPAARADVRPPHTAHIFYPSTCRDLALN